ncbi:gliding motility-associated C-terminal domain-containing protein [Dyadobacter sp. 3J3]|uniref:T9SS type B sorting domain-containing protein n=1 Tax=Dyadobacter sp. 3J3 TaxID=2606600 RepID=UPI0013573370|nr:gliding motility-associated C-terminal domain-containing protein [Dyadobacter sp. 3J3]
MKNRYRIFAIQWFSLLVIVSLSLACFANAANSEPMMVSFKDVLVKPDFDSIVLLTPDTYCRDTNPIILTVTGENITWYADASKLTRLAQGNSYNPSLLNKTTTYFLSQTIKGIESPVKAITIEIVEYFLTDVKTTRAGCGKNDGTMTVSARGGSVSYPLRYQLDDGPLQLSPVFTNLSAGTYKLAVYAANCWGSIDITVDGQTSPIISAIDSNSPHCGSTDGSLRIVAYGGTGILSYSLNGIDFKDASWFENLSGGVYKVSVRDDSLCTVSKQISLKNSIKLQLNAVGLIPTSCGKPNGQVTVNDAEGNGQLTYSLTGHSDQQLPVFDNLYAGNYQVSAKDEDGCSDTQLIAVADSEGPIITHIDKHMPTCDLSDGGLTISITGRGNHFYSIDGEHYQQDSSFARLSAGNYIVTVKDDANCTTEKNINLDEPCGQQLYLPTSFTPNNDGINDSWTIYFPVASLDIKELTIYNRWGEVIFNSKPGSVQSGTILWDGSYKGIILNGLFTYQIRVQLSSGQSYLYHSTIIIL